MKTIRYRLKTMANLLSLVIIFQSCTIYQSSHATIDEAISSNNKVKLYTENDQPFKFEKLEEINGEIYGLVSVKSSTYKMMKSRDSIPNKYKTTTYVKLYKNELSDIRLKNKTASTVVSVAVPAAVLTGLLLIINEQPYVGGFLDND